jgi:hypothetical protein
MIGIVGAHPAGDGQLRGPKRSSISERPVSPDLGYVAMNEHITQYDGKAENVYGAETGSV